MKCLQNREKESALKFIESAIEEAKKSTCQRSKCGSVIVGNGKIIGKGFNSPPAELESQRRCSCDKNLLNKKITDKTCCIHAEQRAIFDALGKFPLELKDSTLYFIRLSKDNQISFAGKPYCTICSKMALDCGIKTFVLYHENGIYAYDTQEYNKLSYEF